MYIYIYILTCCSVAKSSYSQVDLTSLACPGPVALTDLHRFPGQFLNEFDDFGVPGGSFWAQRWMPEATLKDHGSSHAKCFKNGAKFLTGGAFGSIWGSEGRAREALGTICTLFWRLRAVFLTICLEKCVFAISMPICSRIATFVRLGDQVGATWTQNSCPGGPKSPRTGKS